MIKNSEYTFFTYFHLEKHCNNEQKGCENMARILTEKRNINDNVFEYEKRLQSPYNRYIDKFPTYVTYYHISNDNTTVNEGWKDTEQLLGENSSLRFQKINDFPLYGINQIVISLIEEEQGLDGGYEGEAVFLPHTIKPFQNDFFVIDHLTKNNDVYIFRITEIEFDNIHPDNFYKVNFRLEGTDLSMLEDLENQVINKFICISENIGTENQCIIEHERYEKIRQVEKLYDDISSTYLSIFYNEKYNCLLGEKACGKKLYDPFLIEFVNKWGLFNDKNRLNTYIFNQEIQDNRFQIKYEKSVWRFIERQDMTLLNNFYYYIYPAMRLPYTTFAIWYDASIFVLDISLMFNSDEECDPVISDAFIKAVKENLPVEGDYAKLIKSYIRKEELDVYSVPLTLNESLLTLDANLDFFFMTPIILFIIRKILNKEMTDKTILEKNSLSV